MGELEEIAAGATKLLNTEGYAFEQAVIQYCSRMHLGKQSSWRFVVSECPVSLHDDPIHIDFVLEHTTTRDVIVAECKRVDPAKGRWCFVKRPYTGAGRVPLAAVPVISRVKWDPGHLGAVEQPMQVSGETPYHLCLELRITNQQGDGVGAAPNKAMKTAADQAFRSASGFLSRTKEERHWQLRPHTSVMVLPVIFTTAELLTTDTPISDADIKTGKVEGLTLGRARWVWFQENLSKRLLPEGLHLEDHEPVGSNTLERFVMRRHTRALVVVNAEYVAEFLQSFSDPLSLDPI